MKKIVIIILLFYNFKSNGQSYIPLNLDTSSYWVFDYRSYFAGEAVHGEKTTQVFGDTIISGKKYFKLVTFATIPPEVFNPTYLGYYYTKDTQLIREDTITKQVFEYIYGAIGDNLILDFNLSIGDTMPMIDYQPFNNFFVDSIDSQLILGVTRKIQHSHFGLIVPDYQTIEGIGATINFPPHGIGEWGIPFYTLKCYSKNGVQLFGDASTPCIKSFPLTFQEKTISNIECKVQNRNIIIENSSLNKLEVKLINLNGQIISKETTTQAYLNLNYNSIPSGIYILHISSNKNVLNKKINFE